MTEISNVNISNNGNSIIISKNVTNIDNINDFVLKQNIIKTINLDEKQFNIIIEKNKISDNQWNQNNTQSSSERINELNNSNIQKFENTYNIEVKIIPKPNTSIADINSIKHKTINIDMNKLINDTYNIEEKIAQELNSSKNVKENIKKTKLIKNELDSWEYIKNNVADINGNTMTSSTVSNLTYTNEDIMVMFIFKLNDRYRYSSLVDLGLLSDMDKIFTETYDSKTNYYDYAVPSVENYISDIQNKINEIKSEKDVKSKPLIFNVEAFYEDLKIDSYLLATAIPQLTNLAKYRYLAKLLYEKDKKYLDLAKESIINQNNNVSLDMMVLGTDDVTKVSVTPTTTSIEHFNNEHFNNEHFNNEHFNNSKKTNRFINILIICIILIIIIVKKNTK